jgi:hypothetical protein
VAAVAIAAGVMTGSVLANPRSVETRSVECSENDLILVREPVLGADATGGPALPEEALRNFLARDYPNARFEEFSRVSDESEKARYDYEREGTLEAIASMETYGDSWYVTEFSACNSLLVEFQSGRS